MSDAIPLVSVVLPVYNEERCIERCLLSILNQDYPRDRYEVIVADGGSNDRTREIIARLGAGRDVRIIDNPKRNQAAGLNLAIRSCRGSVIARQDGHAEWTGHHLRTAVGLLMSTGADNVGGQQDAVGDGAMGRAIANALHSPFGAGGARFRYASQPALAHTAFLGVFRRSVFERVGLFNESFPPHEDYDLNTRIRATGGHILYSPGMPTTYHVRETLADLVHQYFRYGRAKVRVARTNPSVMRPYHLASPMMVGALVWLAVNVRSRPRRRVAVALGATYAAAAVFETARCGAHEPIAVKLRIPLAFAGMQLAWGTGFWVGISEALVRRTVGDSRRPPRLSESQ